LGDNIKMDVKEREWEVVESLAQNKEVVAGLYRWQ
jgi:hypothetical protein